MPDESPAAQGYGAATIFADRDEYEIGKDYGRGWIVLRPAENGVRLAVGERGLGHDEPSKLHGFALTFAEAAELRDALSIVVPPETEPTETRQWNAPICDGCGEPIRNANDRNAGSDPEPEIGGRRDAGDVRVSAGDARSAASVHP